MNCIIANGVCFCPQCCCKKVFETMSKLIGKSSFIKIMYFIIYAFFVLILLGAFAFLGDCLFFMSYIAQGIHCNWAGFAWHEHDHMGLLDIIWILKLARCAQNSVYYSMRWYLAAKLQQTKLFTDDKFYSHLLKFLVFLFNFLLK